MHQVPPYSSKAGRRAMNADDEIFADGGDQLVLALERSGRRLDGAVQRGAAGVRPATAAAVKKSVPAADPTPTSPR